LPLTVTFHPDPLPVASRTVKLVIAAFVVWAWPFSVIPGIVGIPGATKNTTIPR
jgi:hypothetical protein